MRVWPLLTVAAVLALAACDASPSPDPVPPSPSPSQSVSQAAATPSPAATACADPEIKLAAKPVVGEPIIEAVSVLDYHDGQRDQQDYDQNFAGAQPTLVWDAPGLDVGVGDVNGVSISNVVGEQLSDWGDVEAAIDVSAAGDGFAFDDKNAGLVVAYRRVRPMTAIVHATCGGQTWTGAWASYTRQGTTIDECDSRRLPSAAKQACSSFLDDRGR